MADGVLDEADTVAKRVVELAISTNGPQSNEFAKALTNLAIVQHQTQQYDAAQQNFATAIEIIEDNEDRLNAQLVNPLKGLGASQLESGRPDLATITYRRAVHVTHVNEGPHNLEQVDLLESLAETSIRMGDFDTAKQIQDTIYALNIRKYDLDTIELIPSLMRRAAWQHRAGFVFDERATYRRVIRIVEENSGKQDIALIEPLIMLGKSFFYPDISGTQTFQDARLTSGEIYFRRAAKIAAESPDSDWQVLAQTTLSLGDFYMFDQNPQRGDQAYRTAWELLSADDEKLVVRREQLETVFPLWQQMPPEYINSADAEGGLQSDDPLLQGQIAIAYDISTRGRATNLKLVKAEPPEFTAMQRSVQREIRRRVYRPRFEDAKAVATPDRQLVHNFFYRQSDLDSVRAEAKGDAAQ
jgi:tetratricopeptide (TPR) repeat protein